MRQLQHPQENSLLNSGSYAFHKENTLPQKGWVWVFGSNLAGRHGLGAAKVAHVNFGAPYGAHSGAMGQAYAIPTKDKSLRTLPIEIIKERIDTFMEDAHGNPKKRYFVTRVGCGLAGYTDAEIAPLFKGSPANCSFSEGWKDYL